MSLYHWQRFVSPASTSQNAGLGPNRLTASLEKHIEFDLGGLGRDTITRDYLNQLSKHLQFESILKYVALPKLAMEAPPRQKKSE